jgi:hypothetical protein
MAMKFIGSICLTDIPKSEIKAVQCKDGKTRAFLNISIHEKKEPFVDANGKVLSDHLISCAPKKDERKEGQNYIIGNLRTWQEQQTAVPTPEDIASAPSFEQVASEGGSLDLPF